MFDLTEFIAKYVTKRPQSMFLEDINRNHDQLTNKIKDKTVLAIGGAGSIGSSFVKAILPFEPATLVVVDTNENDESINEMLKAMVTVKAKQDSDFKSFISRCIKGEWEI